ncbi:MAG TPA: hypothetical protein VN628_06055 [Vicinamibacterales bacterium]|nr:hypothetical protein [Vicinamibacterales bacterium]
MKRILFGLLGVVCLLALPGPAFAQTDEIQVYDGGLADVGKFNLTWHNNFIPKGLTEVPFPGGNSANRSFNGVTEWAYGVTPWFEAGLYLPLYSVDRNNGGTFNGFKLRALFAVPKADERTFFYGVNYEFSVNRKNWDENRITSEVRPIIGWHLKPWDIIVNPILDTAWDGVKNLDFAPATRIAYNVNEKWAVALEEYADYGPLHDLAGASDQVHQFFAVVNHSTKFVDIEAGVGIGVTNASDKVTFKLLLSKDLN